MRVQNEVKGGMEETYINDIRRQPLILNITLSSTGQLSSLCPLRSNLECDVGVMTAFKEGIR